MEHTNLVTPDGYHHGPVGAAFGLTYAAYHVLARRTLQSMPVEWQARFVAMMEEARKALPDSAFPSYQVIRMEDGRFAHDPHRQYRLAGPIPHVTAGAAPFAPVRALAGGVSHTDHRQQHGSKEAQSHG